MLGDGLIGQERYLDAKLLQSLGTDLDNTIQKITLNMPPSVSAHSLFLRLLLLFLLIFLLLRTFGAKESAIWACFTVRCDGKSFLAILAILQLTR